MSNSDDNTPSSRGLSDNKRRLLEQRLRGRPGKGTRPKDTIERIPAEGPRPASPGQQWIFVAQQSVPASAGFNISSSFDVRGSLDPDRLEMCLNTVVQRHEVLKSHYRMGEAGVDMLIESDFELTLERIQCRDVAELESRSKACAQKPFELTRGPLLRVHLLTEPGGKAILILVIHDIIFDKWSLGLFWKETAALYRTSISGTSPELPTLDIQYGDFARWQHEQLSNGQLEQQLTYWKRQLSDLPPPLSLNTDRPYPGSLTDPGRLERHRLSPELTRKLKAFAADRNASLFMVTLLAWQILLSKSAGTSDIIVASPIANRRRRETASLIGFFLSTVALRSRFGDDPSVKLALSRLRAASLEAIENQDVPFNRVVEAVRPPRLPGRHPLCQVMFVYQREDEAAPSFSLGDTELRHIYVETETSKFDATLFAAESGDAMEVILEYRTDLFDRPTTRRLLRRYEQILTAVVETPEVPISQVNWLPSEERSQVLREWQGASSLPDQRPLVTDAIVARADDQPDHPAVTSSRDRMTYRELERASRVIADRLRDRNIGPGSHVAHLMDRGPAAVAAVLGILRSGAAYVPIDPNYPDARKELIIRDAGIQICVTDQAEARTLEGIHDTIEVDTSIQSDDPAANRGLPELTPDEPAYLIYTSGSTGQPKGVVVTYRNLAYSTAARVEVYRQPPKRFLLIPSFAFDSSIAGIFWTLAQGGTLVVPTSEELRDPNTLRNLIRDQQVTDLLGVPTLYREVLRDATDELDTLKRVIVAGEACSRDLVAKHFARRPEAELFNEYGPTEATVWATVHECTPEEGEASGTVPIGRPIPGMKAFVLDAEARPLPIGAPGELFLGGPGVTQGYWNQQELTAERFTELRLPLVGTIRLYRTGDLARWKNDGTLEFMGRTDDQMKIRGYRIEAGEIESVLKQHPSVEDAVVVAVSPPGSHSLDHLRLVAHFVTSRDHDRPESSALRAFLGEKLPEFMVPGFFSAIRNLPQNPNGKIDRNALARLGIPARGKDRTTGPVDSVGEASIEDQLLSVWRESLGVPSIEPDDDFFEAGGDSILAIQMVSKLARVGLEVQLTEFFEAPTVSKMATVLRARTGGTKKVAEAQPTFRTGPVPLSAIQQWFFGLNLVGSERWNQARCLIIPKETETNLLEKALEVTVNRHPALRHVYSRKPAGWLQVSREQSEAPDWITDDALDAGGDGRGSVLDRVLRQLHGSMRLDSATLLRAGRIRNWNGDSDLCVLAVHHLAVDTVSWSIILDDLSAALDQIRAGDPVDLPAPTADFATWSHAIHAHAHSESIAQEADHWIRQSWSRVLAVAPECGDISTNTEASARLVFRELDLEETKGITSYTTKNHRTELRELLVAGLAHSLAVWQKTDVVGINMEGHGRELFDGCPDVSRTVGWFTSTFPILIEFSNPDNTARSISDTRSAMRALPNKGLGFGLLKYLRVDPAIEHALAQIPDPDVTFNFLGIERSSNSAPDLPTDRDLFAHARNPEALRTSVFEINCWIVGGRLQVAFSYSRNLHRSETAELLADRMMAFLVRAAQDTEAGEDRAAQPADFPDAGLDQEDLSRLLDRFD